MQPQADPNQYNAGYYGYGQGYGYAPPAQNPNLYYGGYPGYGNYPQQQQQPQVGYADLFFEILLWSLFTLDIYGSFGLSFGNGMGMVFPP